MKKSYIVAIFIVILAVLIIGVSIYYYNYVYQCQGCGFVNPPKDTRCNLEPESGTCKARISRYYFNQQEGICKEFIWGGCGGVVPFETLEECKKICE